jgi:GNAT superfamily N-acetyltransferase
MRTPNTIAYDLRPYKDFDNVWIVVAYDLGARRIIGDALIETTDPIAIANGPCKRSFASVVRALERQKAARPVAFYRVAEVEVEPAYRGLGIGFGLYDHVLRFLDRARSMVLVADYCSGDGTTSADARRVYGKLRDKYVSSGLVISNIRKATKKARTPGRKNIKYKEPKE